MRVLLLVLITAIVCLAPFTAIADWDDTYPWTKWLQMPDEFGLDVKVTTPKILADDFLCEEPVPITDIHFWGSWKGGTVGQITGIHLSIHNDLVGAEPSQPAEEIWSVDLDGTQFDPIPWGTGDQGWYNPNTGEYIEHDHNEFWLINVFLDEADWFRQKGTPANPIVYWLDIQVTVADPINTDFGWKTSIDHWRDDAAWRDVQWPDTVPWEKLEDPLTGQTLDMAFVLTTVPEPSVFVLAGLGLLMLFRRWRR
jgi:hypothetical protein